MKKSVKVTLSVLLALVIAAAAFAAGYFAAKLTANDAVASYKWFMDVVEKNYYFGGVDKGYSGEGLSAIADKYLDAYSEYYTAEEYAETMKSNSGSKSGIGISYAYVDGKGIYISSVSGNSPAYMRGLRAGEWLEKGSYDGKETRFESSSDFQKLVSSAKDNEDIKLTATDGAEYVVYKAEYTASYSYFCTNNTAWIFKDSADGGLALYEEPQEKIKELPDGVGYIRLSQFYGTALALDLRSNGGGYVSVMQNIAGSFANGERKPAMYSSDKRGNMTQFDCAKINKAEYRIPSDTTVYALANSGTASASEALLGAMICYGALEYENIFLSNYSDEYVAWLKGTGQEVKNERTYGKGIMQSTFVNDATGEALKLTTAKIFWPDGKTCIHDRGITLADGCVSVNAAWQHTKGDEELKSVLEKIKSE